MSMLSRFFKPTSPSGQAQLPVTLVALLESRDFGRYSEALRQWCMANKAASGREALLSFARARGWPEMEAEKLSILFDYYQGNVVLAFERSRPYMSGERFDPDLYVICLVGLFQNNQFEDAHRALAWAPVAHPALFHRAEFWLVRAHICWAVNDMPAVEEAIGRAIACSPESDAVLSNAFCMYIELNRIAEAKQIRSRLEATGRGSGYMYAWGVLALGDWEKGFACMEGRYHLHEAERYLNRALFTFPRWCGEPLRGRRLLLSAEQGLGDSLQMVRYLPVLFARQPASVVIEAQPELTTLIEHNYPRVQVVPRKTGTVPPVDFDLWTGMMSLPHLARDMVEGIPGRSGYLEVPPDNALYWRERVSELSRGKGVPRIGIAWSGQPGHRADRRRSIPLGVITDALRAVDADFYALQTHVPAGMPANLINVAEEMVTMADTAALIMEMDLVISVDTSVIHLAGALGKEAWLLLPFHYEWRWGLEGEGNDWYDSVKVLRQKSHGDWQGLLGEVFRDRFRARFAMKG